MLQYATYRTSTCGISPYDLRPSALSYATSCGPDSAPGKQRYGKGGQREACAYGHDTRP